MSIQERFDQPNSCATDFALAHSFARTYGQSSRGGREIGNFRPTAMIKHVLHWAGYRQKHRRTDRRASARARARSHTHTGSSSSELGCSEQTEDGALAHGHSNASKIGGGGGGGSSSDEHGDFCGNGRPVVIMAAATAAAAAAAQLEATSRSSRFDAQPSNMTPMCTG